MKNPHVLRLALLGVAFAATMPGLANAAVTSPTKLKKNDVSGASKLVELKPGPPSSAAHIASMGRTFSMSSSRVGGVKPNKAALIESLHLSNTK